MISRVPCCKSPVKPVKRAAQRAQKQQKLKYTLPYTLFVERQAMHLLGNVGKTQREVASRLNVDRRTVQRQMKKFRETNTFLNKEKKGRQSKLTELRLTAWVEEVLLSSLGCSFHWFNRCFAARNLENHYRFCR